MREGHRAAEVKSQFEPIGLKGESSLKLIYTDDLKAYKQCLLNTFVQRNSHWGVQMDRAYFQKQWQQLCVIATAGSCLTRTVNSLMVTSITWAGSLTCLIAGIGGGWLPISYINLLVNILSTCWRSGHNVHAGLGCNFADFQEISPP